MRHWTSYFRLFFDVLFFFQQCCAKHLTTSQDYNVVTTAPELGLNYANNSESGEQLKVC